MAAGQGRRSTCPRSTSTQGAGPCKRLIAMREIPPIRELLERRAGEEMALNDRYLNPQMGRILRTLGFDQRWVGGDRSHLIAANGERYLDLICGYGVFALGRNHPEVMAAIEDVLDAQTANLPQLGVSLLPGVLAEALVERAPESGSRRWCPPTRVPRPSRGRSSWRAPRPAGRASSTPATPSGPHARLAVAQRGRELPRGLRPVHTGLRRRARSATSPR